MYGARTPSKDANLGNFLLLPLFWRLSALSVTLTEKTDLVVPYSGTGSLEKVMCDGIRPASCHSKGL